MFISSLSITIYFNSAFAYIVIVQLEKILQFFTKAMFLNLRTVFLAGLILEGKDYLLLLLARPNSTLVKHVLDSVTETI